MRRYHARLFAFHFAHLGVIVIAIYRYGEPFPFCSLTLP